MGLPNITIALQADNNLYLSRVDLAGVQYIEAVKSAIDIYSRYKLIQLGTNKIALLTDNGLYFSRITRTGGDYIKQRNRVLMFILRLQ
ncbi:hypothetical protein [Photorhabdus akhurstii]|uniref:fascin domain-containing protein n=2 Tax=Photorhabdus akhurstii TaxID=171438 RepID=UPI003703E3D3